MKNIRVVILVGLFAAAIASAGKKPVPVLPSPTEKQMRNAYPAGVRKMIALAKNPTTIRIDPIEKAWFRVGNAGYVVEMLVVFDAQNSFGSMIRGTAICQILLHGDDVDPSVVLCDSSPSDFVAIGVIPAGMIQVAAPQPSR